MLEAAGFAEVNGARLYYQAAGQGHPLLLLHAGVADNRMWDDQFAEFGRHYQVVRLDLRGFGQSLVPPGRFSHHDDIAGLLNFLGITKSYVVGMSFGGRAAIDFTLAYPEMVAALVLSAPAVGGYEPSSEAMRRFFTDEEAALERGDLAAATELNLRMWVDGPHRTPDQVSPLVRERVREMQWNIFALPIPEDAEYQPLLPPALTRLAEIQIPTLVMVGELEVPEFIRISELVTSGIAGAQKVIIPGVAHLPGMEKPEIFNKIVLDFLNGL